MKLDPTHPFWNERRPWLCVKADGEEHVGLYRGSAVAASLGPDVQWYALYQAGGEVTPLKESRTTDDHDSPDAGAGNGETG